jgi:hypothetical protein
MNTNPLRRVAALLFVVCALAIASVAPLHAQVATGEDVDRTQTTTPFINVWYGSPQSFGQIGDPVPAVNVLGNVSAPAGVAWLGYTLNGGDTVRLTIGPDSRRLAARGDFNVDIPYPTLLTGANRLVIMARDSAQQTARETVVVNYSRGNTWPRDYTINWSTATSIQDVAQIVDGLWSFSAAGVRTVSTGYDRFIAVGEGTWDDYEVTVPVTIHRFDSSGYAPPSNGGGVGFALRWPGHSDSPPSLAGRQPKTGYLPFGALGLYTYNPGRERLVIVGNNAVVAAQDTTGRVLQMGIQYIFKMRIQTNPGVGGVYRLKVWQSGLPEPPAWDLTAQQTLADPQSGSLLLTAHNVDATFGNVRVVSLADTTVPPSTIRSDDFHTGVLDTSVWRFINPLGDGALGFSGAGTSDAWVKFTVPGGVPHQPWTDGNKAPRIMQPANNTNFEIESRFESPLALRYQIQGMIVQQDSINYLRFDYNSDGAMTRIFCAGLHNGSASVRANAAVASNGSSPLLMRVKRKTHQWTFSYSLNDKTWIDAATFVDTMIVRSVGLFGGNTGSPAPAHIAAADYFFNTTSPIVPEDPVAVGPSITQHPGGRTVAVGQTATFSVTAAGTPPLSYQWQRNGLDLPGATGAAYTTPTLTLADSGARFRCRVSNAFGSVTSNAALLRVLAPPTIVHQPANQTVPAGSQATFTIGAAGSTPLEYQWQRNGVSIPGAQSPAYTTPVVGPGDNGALFRCRVTNEIGNVVSSTALLTVTSGDSGRVTAGIISLYLFDEGSGAVIHDRSGVAPPLDLAIDGIGGVQWRPGFLRVTSSTVVVSGTTADKIFSAARVTNELTVEAWLKSTGPTQGNPPARIVGLSSHQNQRNFGLDQALSSYEFRLRTTATNKQGQPYLETPTGVVTSALTHMVYTRGAGGATRLYRDGVLLTSGTVGGTFGNWDSGYHLFLANTLQSNRAWTGEYHLVAIYSRALTPAEVARNFGAGPHPAEPDGGRVLATGSDPTTFPSSTRLLGNYPNPFNPSTQVAFELSRPAQVRLVVFDILGREVAMLVDDFREAGIYTVTFNASNLAGGMYICRLTAGDYTDSRKVVLLK